MPGPAEGLLGRREEPFQQGLMLCIRTSLLPLALGAALMGKVVFPRGHQINQDIVTALCNHARTSSPPGMQIRAPGTVRLRLPCGDIWYQACPLSFLLRRSLLAPRRARLLNWNFNESSIFRSFSSYRRRNTSSQSPPARWLRYRQCKMTSDSHQIGLRELVRLSGSKGAMQPCTKHLFTRSPPTCGAGKSGAVAHSSGAAPRRPEEPPR
jgi:hypothetical protein